MTTDQLTTAELQAMVLTASAELANRWIAEQPDKGTVLCTHIASGAVVAIGCAGLF